MRRGTLLVVAVLLGLSGCTTPAPGPDGLDDGELGSIGGYAANDDLAFDERDGLEDDELEALKYRTMARIEELRGLEFTEDVDLEVMDRETYREQRRENGDPASPFVNEVWRGAFVVDGETDVNRAFDELYGGAVAGYYLDGRIVLVTDDADDVRIDRTTLVHELVHALQAQRFGLERSATTIDGRRAENGLIEGEASYVPHRYDERCGTEWSCIPVRDSGSGGALEERPFNAGLFLSIYAPYSEGPTFVDALVERGGWDAVDAAHDARPESTSQLIHPGLYPEREPVDVPVTDRSTDGWTPFVDDDGDRRTETIGEATLFATLWYNGVVDRPLAEGATELSPYNYTYAATAGWAGDTFVGYRNATGGGNDDGNATGDDDAGDGNTSADNAGDGDASDGDAGDGDPRTGHVWKLAWESPGDAAQFRDAYRAILENRGAERLADGVYRIPDGERFAGAYRVVLEGDAVVIVGAPTVAALEEIRPETALGEAATASISSIVATEPTLQEAYPRPVGSTEGGGPGVALAP